MSACLSPIDDSIEHIVPWERSPGARCSQHQHKPNWNIEYYCCCSHAPVSAVCSVWLIVWKIHGLELLYFMVMASYHSIILYCYFNCNNKYVHIMKKSTEPAKSISIWDIHYVKIIDNSKIHQKYVYNIFSHVLPCCSSHCSNKLSTLLSSNDLEVKLQP